MASIATELFGLLLFVHLHIKKHFQWFKIKSISEILPVRAVEELAEHFAQKDWNRHWNLLLPDQQLAAHLGPKYHRAG